MTGLLFFVCVCGFSVASVCECICMCIWIKCVYAVDSHTEYSTGRVFDYKPQLCCMHREKRKPNASLQSGRVARAAGLMCPAAWLLCDCRRVRSYGVSVSSEAYISANRSLYYYIWYTCGGDPTHSRGVCIQSAASLPSRPITITTTVIHSPNSKQRIWVTAGGGGVRISNRSTHSPHVTHCVLYT